MSRELWTAVFLIFAAITCWAAKAKFWPKYKRYSVLWVARRVLVMATGLALLWANDATAKIIIVTAVVALVVVSIIPADRPAPMPKPTRKPTRR